MVDIFEAMADIIDFCWRMWTIEFHVGQGISFCLYHVAFVAVVIWIANLIWDSISIDGGVD